MMVGGLAGKGRKQGMFEKSAELERRNLFIIPIKMHGHYKNL